MAIDWMQYRAEVAKVMLPVIYARIPRQAHQLQSAEEMAVKDSVSIATYMARMLEQKLKGDGHGC